MIPREYERGIALIKSLSNSDINRALEALKGAKPYVDPQGISSLLRPALSGMSDTDVNNVSEALHSLYLLRGLSDVSIDRFVDDISEAAATGTAQSAEDRAALKNNLKSLLTVRPLSLLSKANGLLRDAANIFSDAKIISDIRPVWEGSTENPPEGVVIAQTLKITYYNLSGQKEIYISIDKGDVDTLLTVLTRAQEKLSTLEGLAGERWMKILGE